MSSDDIVGSVMPIGLGKPAAQHGASVWETWTEGRNAAAFRTARGALAALLRAQGIRRVLLPSYACLTLAEGCEAAGCATDFFGVDRALRVDIDALNAKLTEGAAVLGIDYFGRAPETAFTDLIRTRSDVVWIEDRAQALDPAAPVWGDYVLYSPRKLFGVADGGVLVSNRSLPSSIAGDPMETARLWLPHLARFEDPDGAHALSWFAESQRREQNLDASNAAMSSLTRFVLEGTETAREAAARRRNYAILGQYLNRWAVWPDVTPSFAPLAFPILAEEGDAMHRALAAQRIFCARHWPRLPSPAEIFPDSHWMAPRCLSVPCDGRYDEAAMHRVGKAAALTLGR